jgi:hypothetical protein
VLSQSDGALHPIAFSRADESVAGNLIKVGAGLAARQAVIDMSEETPNYTIADDLDPDDEMRADADPMCEYLTVSVRPRPSCPTASTSTRRKANARGTRAFSAT